MSSERVPELTVAVANDNSGRQSLGLESMGMTSLQLSSVKGRVMEQASRSKHVSGQASMLTSRNREARS